MLLRPGGLDVFYIDESHDNTQYVVTAVTVPFLRPGERNWEIVWEDYLEDAKSWRKWIRDHLHIPRAKELHGSKLATGRGRYNQGKHTLSRPKAAEVYERILNEIDFLPLSSVISVCTPRRRAMYGATKLELAMHALFQRMRSQCNSRRTNGIVFFDEGHPEYRKLYRRSQIYLPTGSRLGGWSGGGFSQNLPLSMFTKDGNEKNSKHCHFTQIADLIAYAAFLKIKNERNRLAQWQADLNHGQLYDAIPRRVLNINASSKQPRDAIVRL